MRNPIVDTNREKINKLMEELSKESNPMKAQSIRERIQKLLGLTGRR